jgi:hypothetical protein
LFGCGDITGHLAGREERVKPVVILYVLHEAHTYLLEITGAACSARVFARPGKDRKQNGCQNRYDSNNDKQLDQRETAPSLSTPVRRATDPTASLHFFSPFGARHGASAEFSLVFLS